MPEGGRADLQFTGGPIKLHVAGDRISIEKDTRSALGQAISVAPAAEGLSAAPQEPIAASGAAAMHTQPWQYRPICRGGEQEADHTRDGREVLNPFIPAQR